MKNVEVTSHGLQHGSRYYKAWLATGEPWDYFAAFTEVEGVKNV